LKATFETIEEVGEIHHSVIPEKAGIQLVI